MSEDGERYDSMMIEEAEYYLFQDGEVPDMDWFVIEDSDGNRGLTFHCNHLEDGLCAEYERRPNLCQAFECRVLEGEMGLGEFETLVEERMDEWESNDAKEVTERIHEILGRGGGYA